METYVLFVKIVAIIFFATPPVIAWRSSYFLVVRFGVVIAFLILQGSFMFALLGLGIFVPSIEFEG